MKTGKVLFTLLLVSLFYVAGSKSAFAYLDPGTLNMALQIVVGALVSGLVAIKIYWHKILDLFGRKSQDLDLRKADQDKTKN